MRIRSTKPEFWKSRRIASVSWDARLVLKGLESYVDDNGVGIDDIELIVTDVFPRDMFANGRETVAKVSEAITELHQAGLVHRYSTDTDRLLYISWWESIQRIDKPGKGRNPRPDGTFNYRDSEIRESVANVPETLAPGTGEQRNRGTEEKESVPAKPKARTENQTPEHRATDAAYEAVGKAFNFIAVRGMAKWMLEERGLTEQQATRAIVDTYQAGKPITKQVLGQLIDGYNQNTSGSQRRLQQGMDLVQRTAARGQGAFDYDPFEGKAIEQ